VNRQQDKITGLAQTELRTSSNIRQFLIQKVSTGIWSLSPLLGVKIIHFVDRTDLFKISNLVYGGREIVTSL